MAVLSKVTIGTGRKISIDYQSEDYSLIVTWELETNDTDLLGFVKSHGKQVEAAHQTLREAIKAERERLKNNGKAESLPQKESPKRYYPNGTATSSQIQTALKLQSQLGINSMSEDILTNLTKQEISNHIQDLMKQVKDNRHLIVA